MNDLEMCGNFGIVSAVRYYWWITIQLGKKNCILTYK